MLRCSLGFAFAVIVSATPLLAQGKKPPPKDQPKILMALPFGIVPGKSARVTLRGLKLDTAREVRIAPKGSVKLLKKNKVAVPNQQDPARVGDSAVELELTVPADVPGESIELVVISPGGESLPHPVLLDRTPVVLEKEPNDGFKRAQTVSVGQTIQGVIDRGQDVDVFRFEGKAGQKVAIEVKAWRLGSALDSFLTLYDGDGQIVGTNDDINGSTDSRIEATLMKAGTYFVAVTDAHDQGGQTHGYRLSVQSK